jgi:phage shock protein E
MKSFLIVIFLLILISSRAVAADFKNLNVEQFEKMRAAKTNVVLDVRTQKEYDAGHMPGAVLIDWNSPDFEKKVAALDKEKTYLVHCAAGGRSAKASAKLSGMNFKNVYNLEGGYRAWEKAGNKGEK